MLPYGLQPARLLSTGFSRQEHPTSRQILLENPPITPEQAGGSVGKAPRTPGDDISLNRSRDEVCTIWCSYLQLSDMFLSIHFIPSTRA